MRYGTDRKEDSRRQILELASERLRRDGIAGVGLRTIMTDAGLTHGGFYAHFKSRTELVAEALRFALDQTRERLERVAARAEPDERLSRGLAILAGLMGTLQLARALPDGSPSDALLESGRASAIAGATAPWPSCR